MPVTIEPTPELTELTINGAKVKARVWKGDYHGLAVEVFVLSITPAENTPEAAEALQARLPDYFMRSRDANDIKVQK